eukprot:4868039-Prymnesium_polylepis.2
MSAATLCAVLRCGVARAMQAARHSQRCATRGSGVCGAPDALRRARRRHVRRTRRVVRHRRVHILPAAGAAVRAGLAVYASQRAAHPHLAGNLFDRGHRARLADRVAGRATDCRRHRDVLRA